VFQKVTKRKEEVMKKLLWSIVITMVMYFGFQPKAVASDGIPINSYIKVTSFVAVTNGVGGFNYYMYVESYTTNKTRSVWGLTATNFGGPWVKGDTTKVKYDFLYRTMTNNYYYDRFLCIRGVGVTNGFFKPSMDTP